MGFRGRQRKLLDLGLITIPICQYYNRNGKFHYKLKSNTRYRYGYSYYRKADSYFDGGTCT